MISEVRLSTLRSCKMALFVCGQVVRGPECDRDSEGVGEWLLEVVELGISERNAREPDVCGGVSPCIDCFSRRRKDWRRFDMIRLQ